MSVADLRAELEEDLLWRQTELRSLRNLLIGKKSRDGWAGNELRVLMVMQYAHLEGFTRHALAVYLRGIAASNFTISELSPPLATSALLGEILALRNPLVAESLSEMPEKLLRRAKKEVELVSKMRAMQNEQAAFNEDDVISLEMNIGSDVLKRTLYRLGIDLGEIEESHYKAIDFVKNQRNVVAHGGRTQVVHVRLYDQHLKKSDQFMNSLARVLSRNYARETFRTIGGGT
jgi:hypothetical protein